MVKFQKKDRKKIKSGQIYFIIALTLIFCNLFVCRLAFVYGKSMEPSLREKDCVLVWKWFYTPKNGDIIITNNKNPLGQNLVKRVIAVEGQRVKLYQNQLYVDGQKIEEEYLKNQKVSNQDMELTVPKQMVFLMGDNRLESKDSREIGCISYDAIEGKVISIIGKKHLCVRE